MTKIVVMYRSGRTWVCEVEAVGDGDAGEICAAAGTIELFDSALVFEPAVMPWKDGEWRSPTGIVDEWTESSTGFVDASGGRHEARSSSAFSQRGTVEEEYAHARYTLLVNGNVFYRRCGKESFPSAVSRISPGLVTSFSLDAVRTSSHSSVRRFSL